MARVWDGFHRCQHQRTKKRDKADKKAVVSMFSHRQGARQSTSPILYGCEVWGYENTDIIEKVHTKFCKFIFGVSKFAHNMLIYGELARYPLSITIKQRMVCYWSRILKSNQHCMKSYITFIAKIFTRPAGLNILIQFFRIMA